jgi:phage/plasmid primase-like uncharacterized protein
MNTSQAAKALGGEVTGASSVVCPGPGHSPRDRSLSVRFNGDDFTVFSHAGDDWRECRDHVRTLLGLPDFTPAGRQPSYRPRSAPVATEPTPEERERTERAGTIWREAGPIDGTPGAAYLAGRGLAYRGEALRWHPACPFEKTRQGCMIGLVRNICTNQPQAVHRTAIDPSGRKIGRKAYGPTSGGAVKLTDDDAVTMAIAIGEGIETTLSIREVPDLGRMPVWSVLSAGGISTFPALPGIESVWIAADNDASGTGQKAARTAAERLNAAGIETIVLEPLRLGADLNEVAHHA